MTREEAIRHIRDVIAENNSIKPNIVTFEQEKEALYMAIEALQNLSKPNNTCEVDLISRQAAVDAIPQTSVDAFENCRYCNLLDIEQVIDIIKSLPSADRPTGECRTCGRNADNGGVHEDGRTKCPIQEHYALLLDGYCHLYEPYDCGAKMGGEEE